MSEVRQQFLQREAVIHPQPGAALQQCPARPGLLLHYLRQVGVVAEEEGEVGGVDRVAGQHAVQVDHDVQGGARHAAAGQVQQATLNRLSISVPASSNQVRDSLVASHGYLNMVLLGVGWVWHSTLVKGAGGGALSSTRYQNSRSSSTHSLARKL